MHECYAMQILETKKAKKKKKKQKKKKKEKKKGKQIVFCIIFLNFKSRLVNLPLHNMSMYLV